MADSPLLFTWHRARRVIASLDAREVRDAVEHAREGAVSGSAAERSYERRFGFPYLTGGGDDLAVRLERTYDVEVAAVREMLRQRTAARLEQMVATYERERGGEQFTKEFRGWLPSDFSAEDGLRWAMRGVLERYNLAGMQVGFFSRADPAAVQTYCEGLANMQTGEPVKPWTRFQLSAISKAFGAALVLSLLPYVGATEYSRVNDVLDGLRRLPSDSFRLTAAPGVPPEYADEVQVKHLLSHTAGMEAYDAPGLGAEAQFRTPSAEQLLSGEYPGYQRTVISWRPGTHYQYSEASFLVAQLLAERIAISMNRSLPDLARSFFKALGLDDLSFGTSGGVEEGRAVGYLPADLAAARTWRSLQWLWYPPFVAGAVCSAGSVCRLLVHLVRAYEPQAAMERAENGSAVLPHDVATRMMQQRWRGTRTTVRLMGCRPGLSGFVCENADGSKFFLHPARNDGFRGLSLVCFAGPHRGRGMVVLTNTGGSDALRGVCEVAQTLLLRMGIEGLNADVLRRRAFDTTGIPPSEIVTRTIRHLIVEAFQPLGAPVSPPGIKCEPDDGASECLLVSAKPRVLYVSNDKFARASNLFASRGPQFNPDAFNPMGKTMDSWESVRHNVGGHETLDLALHHAPGGGICVPHYAVISTAWHDGNHGEAVGLDALLAPHTYDEEQRDECQPWVTLFPRTPLEGHSLHLVRVALEQSVRPAQRVAHLRVLMYPDGGVSRLRLFTKLPAALATFFGDDLRPGESVRVRRIPQAIPPVRKPLALASMGAEGSAQSEALTRLREGDLADVASAALGGEVVASSNEHYGPASAVISPLSPQGMYDGYESARSRTRGHEDWVKVRLAVPVRITSIQVDFIYFVNNNPRYFMVEAHPAGAHHEVWLVLVPKTHTKPYAGNVFRYDIVSTTIFDQVRFVSIPDGGFNRVHVYTVWSPSYLAPRDSKL